MYWLVMLDLVLATSLSASSWLSLTTFLPCHIGYFGWIYLILIGLIIGNKLSAVLWTLHFLYIEEYLWEYWLNSYYFYFSPRPVWALSNPHRVPQHFLRFLAVKTILFSNSEKLTKKRENFFRAHKRKRRKLLLNGKNVLEIQMFFDTFL